MDKDLLSDKVFDWVGGLWKSIPLILIGSALAILLGLGWLLVANFGFGGGLLVLVAVVVSAWTVRIPTVLSSIGIGMLLKLLLAPLAQLTGIWFSGTEHTQFFALVSNQSYVSIIAVLFFVGYLVDFVVQVTQAIFASMKFVRIAGS